jgi:hypothetical protein
MTRPSAVLAWRRWMRLRTMEAADIGRYVLGPILTVITGMMCLPLAKRPLVLRRGRAFGLMALPKLTGRTCGTFTRAVAAAAT